MSNTIPGAHVVTDPQDLSPAERLTRFQREMDDRPPEEWGRTLEGYLSPDPITVGGKVVLSSPRRTSLVGWRDGLSAPGDGEAFADPANPRFRRYVRKTAFPAAPPPRRTPHARAESLLRRYAAEWRKGNEAILAGLLRELCGAYWREGMPITEDALRMLVKASLEDAERRLRDADRKRTVRRWAG